MSKTARVLVSNIALPTTNIGSWTTRMGKFLSKNSHFFDFVLSATAVAENSLYCKKRSFITWKKPLRKIQLLNWVASDYLKQLKKLSNHYDKIIVVVMDDPHLVEAIALKKHQYKCAIELVFSFHGFKLHLDKKVVSEIDRILFLSQTGSEKSKINYIQFPEDYIVGNAVDSQRFFPLEGSKLEVARFEKGYSETDEILIWMANDRPKKGFHIFEVIVEELLKKDQNLKVLVIGSSKRINHPNIKSIGRIPNTEVASYLQIGNYYMFTTLYEEGFGLSMIEALKCGNAVIASNLGAIPEVLNNLKQTYLVENIEDINSWIDSFNLARTNSNFGKVRLTKTYTDKIWNYEDWEEKFINAII